MGELARGDSVVEDARRYGAAFLAVDASIALYKRLGITEAWNEWEYPRRLAVLEEVNATQTTP
jgi:hypothetical protein